MFGTRLDYLILRPLCHRGNMRRGKAPRAAPIAVAAADRQLEQFLGYFGGRLELAGRRVLDVGCGGGEFTLALARKGAHVVGVDIEPRRIEEANDLLRAQPALAGQAQFVCGDIFEWSESDPFDLIISRAAFEHVERPGDVLGTLVAHLRRGGLFASVFGPMFHSPFGDHLWGFFRVQIPWRGVLFDERALLRLRRELYRPDDPAQRLEDITGGLNKLRYGEFARLVSAAGCDILVLRPNATPGNRRLVRIWFPVLDLVGRVPVLRDYLAHAPCVLLRKR